MATGSTVRPLGASRLRCFVASSRTRGITALLTQWTPSRRLAGVKASACVTQRRIKTWGYDNPARSLEGRRQRPDEDSALPMIYLLGMVYIGDRPTVQRPRSDWLFNV